MEQSKFIPGVTTEESGVVMNMESAEEAVREVDFTEDEDLEMIRGNEEDFIQGLIHAAGYAQTEKQKLEIIRDGKLFFAFHIRPLSEDEYERCKKKNTRFVRNKRLGMKVPEETNAVRYRASLIYQATVMEDREKLWDNRKVWESLKSMGLPVMNGLDVIEYSLKAGEKDRVLEAIDSLSGYADTNLEEVAKN
ncbi:hypothetical protein VSQ32_03425 [Lachnospiraceae bacterium KK002]